MLIRAFLLSLLLLVLSYADQIKLISKKLPVGYIDFYPLKDYLVLKVEYRGDNFFVVVNPDTLNTKVYNVLEYPRGAYQIDSKVYGTSSNRNRFCVYELIPDFKQVLCLDIAYIEKELLKAKKYRETLVYQSSILEDGNLAFLLSPRKPHNITEFLFGGKEYLGVFVVLDFNKKVLLNKKLNTEYKSTTLTSKGVLYIKNNKLYLLDSKGKTYLISQQDKFKSIQKSQNFIIVKGKNSSYVFYEGSLFLLNSNCNVKEDLVFCNQQNKLDIFSLKKKEKIFSLRKGNDFYQFLCKSGKYFIFSKDFYSFLFFDKNGNLVDKFTPEDKHLYIDCIKGILTVKKEKYLKLFKIKDSGQ